MARSSRLLFSYALLSIGLLAALGIGRKKVRAKPESERRPEVSPVRLVLTPEAKHPENSAKRAIPSYLKHNSWEQELNYKLWVTKGARFAADKRCQRQNFWSKLSLNFLSGYLIVLGLTPSLFQAASLTLSSEILNLSITGVSILALVWGLLESSKQYDLQAYKFHSCALAVGKLYSRLRRAKELPAPQKGLELQRISEDYDKILETADNHEPIDFDSFKLQKPEYFELRRRDILVTRARAFCITHLTYLVITVIPAILVVWIVWPALGPMKQSHSSTKPALDVGPHLPAPAELR